MGVPGELQKIGFEIKFTEQPKVTRSMQLALTTLNLDKLVVVCPGKKRFKLDNLIEVIGLEALNFFDLSHIQAASATA